MINKKYLIEVWNSVWEKGLTELEVQKRYFTKLDKKLKGEDRFHLMAIKTKIDELENGLQTLLMILIKSHRNFSKLPMKNKRGDGF